MSTSDRARSPEQVRRAAEIVGASLALVDEGGLENLTMRRLAEAVGLKLPIIYRLFANKQALVDDMAEAVLANATCETTFTDWEDETVALAGALRAAILAQRDGARIVGGSYSGQPNVLAFADRLINTMHAAGLTGADALWATSTVYCYVLGETLEQQGADHASIDDLAEHAVGGRYPHVFAAPIEKLVDFDSRFEFGIRVLIEGLRGRSGSQQPRE